MTGEAGGGEVVRLAESTSFVEADGWRRALERAGIPARVAQQNDPYLGGRTILYVFQRDVEEAARVLGWVQDPSRVDPAYAEDAAAVRRGGTRAPSRPGRVALLAAVLVIALTFALLAAVLS